ncbi:MAG: M28 family peptidase [Bryobacteraceae bacterium]|nr:M28 family peptidase [Bryobacteraceae bacterium]
MRILFLLLATSAFAASNLIDANRYLENIKFLASDELKGRPTGSPEIEKAAKYIASNFEKFGLVPAGANKNYFQAYKITTSSKLGGKNRLSISQKSKRVWLKVNQDYSPFYFSGSGRVSGGVVFAGYGITAPEYSYDDYDGLDVKDKIVLVLRREPQEKDSQSKWQGTGMTSHASFESKVVNAKQHGARALILINNSITNPSEASDIQGFTRMSGPEDAGIPYVQLKATLADDWFAAAGRPLKEIVEGIDTDLKPRSFAFPPAVRVDLQTDVQRVVREAHNVVGYWPGETDEFVIVGAHYDHLGLGEVFSLAPSETGKVHHGADDNASGTSGVLEIARLLTSQGKRKRGVLFMTFSGEELGLIGSNYYSEHPLLPNEKAITMINMDMIGRAKEGRLIIGGAGTGTTLKEMMEGLIAKHGDLKVDLTEPSGIGGSDHTSFTSKQIPALFFFSGLHADYHKPSDTWDRIDVPNAQKVLALVADSLMALTDAPARPVFVKVEPPAGPQITASGSSSPGYGPYFGSIPDMAGKDKGVRFADVRAGSPAAKAGLMAGDIMVEFDGKKVENLYDYTYALRQKKPGDAVVVKFIRKGQPESVTVTLEQRK